MCELFLVFYLNLKKKKFVGGVVRYKGVCLSFCLVFFVGFFGFALKISRFPKAIWNEMR